MSIHIFDTNMAAKYGLEPAILLQNILFWVEKNRANKSNFHDGRYWTYNSVSAFAELFPYMTEGKIRGSLKVLVDSGLVVTGCYNEIAYDRTLWYSVTEKAFSDTNSAICQNQQMDLLESTNGFAGNDTPIPDINTDINQIHTTQDKPEETKKPSKTPEHFETFWKEYPRRVAKPQAMKKYNALIRSGTTPETILERLEIYKTQIKSLSTETQFIRHPATFLGSLDDYLAIPEKSMDAPIVCVTMAPEMQAIIDKVYSRGTP